MYLQLNLTIANACNLSDLEFHGAVCFRANFATLERFGGQMTAGLGWLCWGGK